VLPLLLVVCLVLPALLAPPAAADEEKPPPSLVGVVSRDDVEAAEPAWVTAEIDATPDAEAARALADVAPGASVTVYLGTWCSDSRRELARLWRGFDDAGIGYGVELPFDLEYVAVDRDKKEPGGRTEGIGLDYVPTFVVRRDGREVGRIVESAPHGVEHDLLALLSGEAHGVVSGRDDLGADADAATEAAPADTAEAVQP
jgi:hypothetical protein